MAKVKIYTSPTCPFCHQAKGFLSQKGIEFEEVDVSKNPQAIEEVGRLAGAKVVPVMVIGDKVIVGFDPAKIESFLKE